MTAVVEKVALSRAATVQKLKTPGGIEVWLVEDYAVPLVAFDFAFKAGSAQDPADKAGVASMLAGLLDEGAPEVRISNRTMERAQALAADFGERVKVIPWDARNEAMQGVALLVNTTTQGMYGQPGLDVVLDHLPAGALVSDAVYIPQETPLLEAARLRGHRTVNGLGMLLNQARPAFAAWFGVMPELTPALRAAVQATF
jgi:shikimate dehydrogenase